MPLKPYIFVLLLICDILADSSSVVKFEPIEIATSENEKKSFRFSPSLSVYTQEKKEKIYPLTFETLIYSEETTKTSKYPFGALLNNEGKPFRQSDNSLRISTAQDSNSIIYDNIDTYLLTHFEESAGAITKSKLTVVEDKLKVLSTIPMNFSSVDGINNVCAGSKTPWNTHLGGEESSAESIYDGTQSPLYLDCENPLNQAHGFCKTKIKIQAYLNKKEFNVYNYGYIVEATVQNSQDKVAKHYVTGKYAPEMAVVTDDNKTIYLSDDGENCAFFKLVLDKQIHSFTQNWQGTLYAAKLTSTNTTQSYEIQWIKLGHASDDELQDIISTRPEVTDFFDISLSPKTGYTQIAGEDTYYIKLKEFEKSAHFQTKEEFLQGVAFLESRKYAATLGASVDMKKEEGLAYDTKRNKLFLALSRIPQNICGAVYELPLDKNYSASKMQVITQGKELRKTDKDYAKYKDEYFCHPDFIANPDNLAYIGNNILLIGEDTTLHFNNMLFTYDTNEKSLTRIATLPTGGEVTGLASAKIQGKQVLFVNTQHPFDDVCTPANEKSNCNSKILQNATHDELRGFVGYIDGIPKDIF